MGRKHFKHNDEELDNTEKNFESEDESDYENDDDFNDDDFNEDDYNDVYEDEYGDEDFDDDFESDIKTVKPDTEKKKEYYVKGSDLIAELKKYQESKKNSPDRQRNNIRRTWNNGNENLHKIFYASTFFWIFL